MSPRGVIRSYYLIAGLYTLAAALIWGVNTLFLLDAGLDIFEVYLANGAFAVGNVLFEIPTGVLADTRGRRQSFLFSVGILFASTLGYLAVARLGGGVVGFAAVSVVLGLGFTFYSGAVEAWLVDALNFTGYPGTLDQVFARGSMVTGGAMLIGTLAGGVLGSVDLALPYVVRAGLLLIVLAVALATMHDWGFTPQEANGRSLRRQMALIAQTSLTFGWRRRPVRWLMLVAFVQMGFLTWGFHAWQPYFLELLGNDAVWVAGVVAALISLSTIAGNALVEWFSRYCGHRTTLLLWAAGVQAVASVGVGLASSFWMAVACFLVVTGAMGVTGPTRQAYLHKVIASEQRASVISFDSMLGNAGAAAAQGGLGYLSSVRSIGLGFVVGGCASLVALPLLLLLRREREEADVIVGQRCECPEVSCAAHGLPEANLVSAVPRLDERV